MKSDSSEHSFSIVFACTIFLQKFCADLTPEEQSNTRAFLRGAVSAPTRRDRDGDKGCECCGAKEWQSIRRCVASCAARAEHGRRIDVVYLVRGFRRQEQPKVSLSAGWITYSSRRRADQRSELTAAVCRAGFARHERVAGAKTAISLTDDRYLATSPCFTSRLA